MKFVLYSLNHAPELTGIGKYNGELIEALSLMDVETHVITAPPYYPEWQRHLSYKNWWTKEQSSHNHFIYRCPLFVPKNVTTIKRIIHLFTFSISSSLRLLTLLRLKPDVLFLVQPTLFCAPAALIYCKLTGAKAIMHIQDFELDAMFGLGMVGNSWLKRMVSFMESWLLKHFDTVSSISFSMLDNARTKGVNEKKLLFFPNWADTEFVIPDISGDNLRRKWGFTEEEKIVLYAGNIGKKQGLEIVLDAAKRLEMRTEIKFVIIGSGAYSKTIQEMARKMGIRNIVFKSIQPWELVPQILAMADVHLIVQRRGAADAVLPSKLTNILSAGGHALVTADADTELGRISDEFPGIYLRVEPENLKEFTAGLVHLLEKDTRISNEVARKYAVENLKKDTVIERFINDITI